MDYLTIELPSNVIQKFVGDVSHCLTARFKEGGVMQPHMCLKIQNIDQRAALGNGLRMI